MEPHGHNPQRKPASSGSNSSENDGRSRSSRLLLPPRAGDSISIPSLSSFLSAESERTDSAGLTLCHSSPILPTVHPSSFSDTERGGKTTNFELPAKDGDIDSGDLNEIDEEDGICSSASDLFSFSPNLVPNPSSTEGSLGVGCDFHSIGTFEASASALNNVSPDEKRRKIYSPKKSRNRPKRKISNWYQVKRETLVKSYRDKVTHFKKIFDGTPVDTDRLLVDYSCALAKNKNGLLLLGRMYITEKWICFYSKIIYELKLHIAVDKIQTVSKAKTARFIPNAIQITLKSNNERYFFTSFTSRERTFAILKKVCENSRNGSGLLPSESEVANVEELLCQVQDVYGDESLAVLDFEEGDDPDDVYPSNREDRVVSSPELDDGLGESSFPSPSSGRIGTQAPLRRRQRSCTDEEVPFRCWNHAPLHRYSTQVRPTTTFSSCEMSGSDTTATSATTDDELVGERIEGNVDGVYLSSRKLVTPEILHRCDAKQLYDKAVIADINEESKVEKNEQLLPVSCGTGHQHPGRTYAALDINVSVDALFACLFTGSQFFASFCVHRGTFDVKQSRWPPKPWPAPTTGDATLHRKISYVLTLKQSLGPRTCRAFETQTLLLRETRPGTRYVVDATVTNEAVPLCNSFHVTSRYCLLRRSATVSHLIITSEVVYDRPVFFGAKSIIDSTCRSNLTDNFTDLVNYLAAAVAHLSDHERVTGGFLALPSRPRVAHLESGSGEADGVGREGDAASKTATTSPGSVTCMQQIPRDFSTPQTLIYPNQQSDRKWFFLIAMSLGLCVLLSMIYNRYQRVERMAEDHLEFTTRASRSGYSCCDELTSVRLLVESVSGVLAQMRTTLDLLEGRLNQLDSESCQFSAKEPFIRT